MASNDVVQSQAVRDNEQAVFSKPEANVPLVNERNLRAVANNQAFISMVQKAWNKFFDSGYIHAKTNDLFTISGFKDSRPPNLPNPREPYAPQAFDIESGSKQTGNPNVLAVRDKDGKFISAVMAIVPDIEKFSKLADLHASTRKDGSRGYVPGSMFEQHIIRDMNFNKVEPPQYQRAMISLKQTRDELTKALALPKGFTATDVNFHDYNGLQADVKVKAPGQELHVTATFEKASDGKLRPRFVNASNSQSDFSRWDYELTPGKEREQLSKYWELIQQYGKGGAFIEFLGTQTNGERLMVLSDPSGRKPNAIAIDANGKTRELKVEASNVNLAGPTRTDVSYPEKLTLIVRTNEGQLRVPHVYSDDPKDNPTMNGEPMRAFPTTATGQKARDRAEKIEVRQ